MISRKTLSIALTSYVLISATAFAQNEIPVLRETYDAPPQNHQAPIQVPTPPNVVEQKIQLSPLPFQYGDYGHLPHEGDGESPAQGYPHYDHPSKRYGHFYRPKAFGRGVEERCAPSPFRPRGYGDLFNEPTTCYRMDYHRFTLKNGSSLYGPSYYRRQPDPRCAEYDYTEKYRPGCNACGERKTKVWTFGGKNKNKNRS
ncbi:MAG: hypothetical protein Tsb009_19480 [Planctomycetaceae bacterium]